VRSDADEFLARSCLNHVSERRLLSKELLCEVDDLPDPTVAAGSTDAGDLLGGVLWRINVV